jgi:dephospho-CoA kinase
VRPSPFPRTQTGPRKMLRVALTGGIATGKSVVARVLERRGCYIFRADEAARALMEPDRPAWRRVVDHFGRDILMPDGTVDRRRLAAILFRDERARAFLDRLIHPLVQKERRKVAASLARKGRTRIFVSEAALTIEAGFARWFDKVVIVWCPPPVQLRRLMERDGLDREEAERRVGAQMDPEEKKKQADYLVDTSGTVKETESQAERLYRRLSKDYECRVAGRKKPNP